MSTPERDEPEMQCQSNLCSLNIAIQSWIENAEGVKLPSVGLFRD